jgi:hypothetical protein
MLSAHIVASLVNIVTILLEHLHEGPEYHGHAAFHTMHLTIVISILGMA